MLTLELIHQIAAVGHWRVMYSEWQITINTRCESNSICILYKEGVSQYVWVRKGEDQQVDDILKVKVFKLQINMININSFITDRVINNSIEINNISSNINESNNIVPN